MFPSDLVGDRPGRALRGTYSADQAVDKLLDGTDLIADHRPDVILIRGRSKPATGASSGSPAPAEIVVTGSRIRGAPIASNRFVLSQAGMSDAGYSNVSDAIRSIPQNFAGGQSPGVGFNVPLASGENVGGGSSIDLRGIGQDATLTLIDGRRLAYGGYRQSTDVSTIPFLAVDRIEIVPDGASAIYGSDAVAGVANVILKRDYDGLSTLARIGGSTDGGNQEQQYSALAGTRWQSGGIVASYDFERDTSISADQRSYSRQINPGLTLYPALKHHSALVNLHQNLTSRLSFEVFSTYNERWNDQSYSIDGLPTSPSYALFGKTKSFAIAPNLTFQPAGDWRFTLSGTYGSDRLHYGTNQIYEGAATPLQASCFCNNSHSVELGADGTVVAVPAGAIKIAAGGGYRVNSLHSYDTVDSDRDVDVSQKDYFAYGELSIPVISPEQKSSFGRRLSIDGAVRFEDYPGIDRVTTPKIGIIYSPSRDIDVKATWGRSFKAPTLYQLNNTQFADAYPATYFGGAAGTAVLALSGANSNLKPERAQTWSVTVEGHPAVVPGLHASASYFHVQYRDRIVVPLNAYSGVLDDPRYTDIVTLDPSPAQVQSAIAGREFSNYTDGVFDPASIVAIIDNRYQNVASQTVQGVDVDADYRVERPSLGSFTISVDLAYIHSTQRLSALQPELPLSGTVFNPPHWRGRAGFVWTKSKITVSSFVNYTGSLRDARYTPEPRISPQSIVDFTAIYRLPFDHGVLHGIEVTGTVRNIADKSPGRIRSDLVYQPGYDSTNYSPLGRVISFSIKKDW